jgi:hypothetical protein
MDENKRIHTNENGSIALETVVRLLVVVLVALAALMIAHGVSQELRNITLNIALILIPQIVLLAALSGVAQSSRAASHEEIG